jgi:hypothetical protein
VRRRLLERAPAASLAGGRLRRRLGSGALGAGQGRAGLRRVAAPAPRRHLEAELKAGGHHERRLQRQALEALEGSLVRLREQLRQERQAHAATCELLGLQVARLGDQAAAWGERIGRDGEQRDRELQVGGGACSGGWRAALQARALTHARRAPLQAVRLQHQRDQQRLEEMQRQLAAEQGAKAERDRAAAEAAQAQERGALEQVQRNRAALRIQAAWRGYQVRAAARGGGKKKGGKAAKGGGGGKKKKK